MRRYQLDYGPQPGVYFARTYFPWQTTVVVRTKGPPLAAAPDVRRAVHEFDPDLPVAKLNTLERTVADSLKVRKIMLVLLAIFALTALVLACVGIYGVISYSVAQRTREVGIRIALGADSSRVVRLILGQGVRLVLIGLAIGILASIGAGLLIAINSMASRKWIHWLSGALLSRCSRSRRWRAGCRRGWIRRSHCPPSRIEGLEIFVNSAGAIESLGNCSRTD